MPDGARADVQMVRAIVAVPPGERVAVALLSVAVRRADETVVVREMVPLKPPMLVNVTVDDASHEPRAIVTLAGAVMVKSGAGPLLLKMAVSTVSGTGDIEPLVIVTHTPPETLVLEHPVWKVRGVFELVPVML